MDTEPPGSAENAPHRAAHDIVDQPSEATDDLGNGRSVHGGADMALEPEKVVVSGDLPARRPGRERPMREVIRIDLERIERQLNRPGLAEAAAGAMEQLVIGLGATRVIALDVQNMPASDRANAALGLWIGWSASRRVHQAKVGHAPFRIFAFDHG